MTTSVGYPPSGLPSGSSQSAPSLPVAANLFAKSAPLAVNIVTDPATGLTIGYLAFDGSINYINGNGQVPVISQAPTITGDNSIGSTLTANPGVASGSPTSWKWQWMRGEDPISEQTGSTYTLTDKDGDGWVWVIGRAVNAQGESAPMASVRRCIRGGAASAGPQPIIIFGTNDVQGQWVRENIVQNTVDRATAGDYYMIGTAGNGGQVKVTKRLPNGTYQTATLITNATEPDDHNVDNLLQLPSGKWMALWNRHAATGATGFRYSITATPHGMDFGAPVVVPGSATWNGGNALSTYTQAYMIGNRVIVFHRVGGSQNGAWVCRYSDNIGAATPTWSAEIFVTPTAYMDSALASDGVTLRCAMYDHPYNTLSHNMYTFDINLSSGDMIIAGGSTVIGNVFANTVPVENSATRLAVVISTGTSRLFQIDGDGNLYGMEMAGGNGTTNWPSGTYYRYMRTSGTGAYTKQAISETGLPFLGGQQGYYGSICYQDANSVLVSVNTGASIGVGSWELRDYRTSNGGASWGLYATHKQSTSIILRPQVLNNLRFWYESSRYVTYTNFDSVGLFQFAEGLVYAPRASRPAGTDPSTAPPAPLTLTGSPAGGMDGSAYSFTPTTAGGTGPYTYDLSAGSLTGSGLSLNASTGAITGTTPVTGTYAVTIRVTDSTSATATLAVSIVIAATGDGFAAVNVHTLTNLTDLGSNRFAATTSAGSQGAILYTGQKKPAGAAAVARLYYTASDASGIVAVGNSTVPTAAASACPRVMQISTAGLLSTVNSGGTAKQTGFQFTAPGAGCWAELRCDAAGMWTVRATQDGGATWTADFPCISSGGANAHYDVETFLRYYTSYAASGTVPRERVIDNPRQQGFAV